MPALYIFHYGEALFLRILTDYEDLKDDLFAVYPPSEDFILFGASIIQCCQKHTECKRRKRKKNHRYIENTIKEKKMKQLLKSFSNC